MPETTQAPSPASPKAKSLPDWLPYAAPMALFLLLTFAEGQAPKAWYIPLYALKAVLVTISLFIFGKAWRHEVKAEWRVLPAAVFVGIVVFAEWMLLDRWIPYPHLGARTAYNPFAAITDPTLRYGFLALRFYGLVVMVPIMEEVFWRSFLLRFVTDQDDFKKIPLGTYSLTAFFVVAGMFAGAHSEWLVAFICAAAYTVLFRVTRNLFACIIAHAVTNLALGTYILITGDWKYW